jgi:hypothetical protein
MYALNPGAVEAHDAEGEGGITMSIWKQLRAVNLQSKEAASKVSSLQTPNMYNIGKCNSQSSV